MEKGMLHLILILMCVCMITIITAVEEPKGTFIKNILKICTNQLEAYLKFLYPSLSQWCHSIQFQPIKREQKVEIFSFPAH